MSESYYPNAGQNELTHAIRELTTAIACAKSAGSAATQRDLDKLEERIMASQADIAASVRKATDTLNKIGKETDKLIQKVADLEEAVKNQPDATKELTDATEALAAQMDVVDNKVPDETPLPAA